MVFGVVGADVVVVVGVVVVGGVVTGCGVVVALPTTHVCVLLYNGVSITN